MRTIDNIEGSMFWVVKNYTKNYLKKLLEKKIQNGEKKYFIHHFGSDQRERMRAKKYILGISAQEKKGSWKS